MSWAGYRGAIPMLQPCPFSCMPRGERRGRPDTWTVMVTWLPSMTWRSERPCRKRGATGLLGAAGRRYSLFSSFFFSVWQTEGGVNIHSFIPQTWTKGTLSMWMCWAHVPTRYRLLPDKECGRPRRPLRTRSAHFPAWHDSALASQQERMRPLESHVQPRLWAPRSTSGGWKWWGRANAWHPMRFLPLKFYLLFWISDTFIWHKVQKVHRVCVQSPFYPCPLAKCLSPEATNFQLLVHRANDGPCV